MLSARDKKKGWNDGLENNQTVQVLEKGKIPYIFWIRAVTGRCGCCGCHFGQRYKNAMRVEAKVRGKGLNDEACRRVLDPTPTIIIQSRVELLAPQYGSKRNRLDPFGLICSAFFFELLTDAKSFGSYPIIDHSHLSFFKNTTYLWSC